MTPNHASYQLMDTTKPLAEDPEQDVPGKKKNKLVNRAFAWMFHVAVTDPQGSLSWLLPEPSKDADSAVDELFQKVMIDEDDNESPLLGPVMLATFAWAVMCAPWYSVAFQSIQQSSTKPSHEVSVWITVHLDWFSRWNPEKIECPHQSVPQGLLRWVLRHSRAGHSTLIWIRSHRGHCCEHFIC